MFLEELGERVKTARLKKSMSQTRLAEIVGYKDKTAISKIEYGKMDIPQSKLVAIAEALDVSVSYLLDGEKYYDDDTAEKAMELLKDPKYRVLFDAARDSRPEDLQMAADLLERLKMTNG